VQQPAPFELVRQDGCRAASNGALTVVLLEAEDQGRLFRRRAVRHTTGGTPGQAVLPELNRLAGDLVARLDMPAAELAERLAQLAAMAKPGDPQQVEWAVAELDGVRVYVDSASVIVTRRDLMP
jgi:hypothetical protein